VPPSQWWVGVCIATLREMGWQVCLLIFSQHDDNLQLLPSEEEALEPFERHSSLALVLGTATC